MNYIIAHKVEIAAALAGLGLLISEIMPFLPAKYNGIAQALVAVLPKKKPDASQPS